MSTNGLPTTTIEKVAARLEGDIRHKGLRPGDRYLTAAEASQQFAVSSMTMHRAMQVLAGKELLVRQRSRGTFVGPGFRGSHQTQQDLDVLHLVMAMDYHRTQSFSSDVLVDEFSASLPGATVQVHHILESAAQRYIGRVIESIGDSKREGFVLIRCPRAVQMRVGDAGLPAVVYGQAYPGVHLSCVKHDQEAIGRLIVEYALEKGARRFALLTHARWRFGDHQMIDAATATLGAAGVQLDSVLIRSLPPDQEVVEEVVAETLNADDPPDAFLCRNDFYARIANDVIRRHGLADGKRTCVVSGSHAPLGEEHSVANVSSSMTLSEQVEHISRLLSESARNENDGARTIVIPVVMQTTASREVG